MNLIKPFNRPGFWQALFMLSTTTGLFMGVYGRKRHTFRSDFTFNKYHFGVFIQLSSAFGMKLSQTAKNPAITGLLFAFAIGLNSIPAYREGLVEIRDLPDLGTSSTLRRKIGLYCLITGYSLLVYWNRTSLPFVMPR